MGRIKKYLKTTLTESGILESAFATSSLGYYSALCSYSACTVTMDP